MPVPDSILQLVEQFEAHRLAYHAPDYNEAQARREFIDPFFEALGWDIFNKQGYAQAYKDVIHEGAIKVGGATKAPDYAFRIGGTRKFFVEAKKPAINVKEEIPPAYQLRRYAWSAKLPLSILTDFEEFAVYDCRNKPNKSDKVSTGRILLLSYRDYPSRWEEINAIFSRQAVLKGSFDQYAESATGKRGTAEVDDVFLAEIERWRDLLAHNIALRNPSLSQRDLNYAVQMTIDRLIFLRICEDRGIEFYGQLQALLNGGETYARLVQLFRKADERYNSGLFHFRPEREQADSPDTLTLGLALDDKPLKDILGNLYYPDSPYEFSVLPADILGQVYERFLGKVIRLTSGHRAVVEDKPEVKKAGGVFYTPTFIVEYIVKNTLGKLLENKRPGQVGLGKGAPLRILDMACGSGSFLLGAFQYLLDWYLNGYSAEAEKWAKGASPKLYQVASPGEALWKLTTTERKRILLDHIYGVDIDPQAVEVTKLSLLLKVLEGESEETIGKQLSMFRERALPDLGRNIKCGNSLIAPDFYTGQQASFLDAEEQYRINAFDWQKEFASAFASSGGFDVIIGNPPYGATFASSEMAYIRSKFSGASRSYDSYELFLIQGTSLLTEGGMIGVIIPASWMTGDKYLESRKLLISSLTPVVAYAMPFDVFPSAYIDTAVIIFSSSPTIDRTVIHYFPKREKLSSIPDSIGSIVAISSIRGDEKYRLSVLLSEENLPIVIKLGATPIKFGDWFNIQRGVQPYSRSKHTEKQILSRFLHANARLSNEYLPELQGNELSRYYVNPKRTSFLRYCDEIASSRPINMFQGERLVIRRLLTRKFHLQASKVDETMITTDNVLNAVPTGDRAKILFALGILNSKIISWFYVNTSMIAQKDDFPQVHISALKSLPIPNFDVAHHDQMVSLVECMLSLHQQLASAKTPNEKTFLQRQIDATDKQIDALVYELYGLTEEEIRVVEGG